MTISMERYEQMLLDLTADPAMVPPGDLRGTDLALWTELRDQVKEIGDRGDVVEIPTDFPG